MSALADVERLGKLEACRRHLQTLKESLTCPICQNIMRDPSIIICGHMFCFDCINNGIENGVYREPVQIEGTEKINGGKKAKLIKFSCPICETATYKWGITRLPSVANFIKAITIPEVDDDKEECGDNSEGCS